MNDKRKRKRIVTVMTDEFDDFNWIYEKYRKLVYRLSLKYSGYDEALAEDATQHAFMQLFIEMEKGTEINNIETYLHTVVKNYTLNQMKKLGREISQDESEDTKLYGAEEIEKSAEGTCFENMDKHLTNQMLEAILMEMKKKNPIWYAIMIEVYYHERSQLEVARELGLTDTAMYATMRRIRKWSNKHKLRFSEYASVQSEKASYGRLLFKYDENTH